MKGLPKVLFVDDQDEVLEDIKVQVSDVCDPYGATTSEEGLEIFENEGPFTVVVSDQILPGVRVGFSRPSSQARSTRFHHAPDRACQLRRCHDGSQ